MRGRITIRSVGLKDITVQFKADNYNGIILKGRETVKRRARGFMDSERKFQWVTQVMNRRMTWQIVEMGNEQDLKTRGHQIPSVPGVCEGNQTNTGKEQQECNEFPRKEQSKAGETH